MTTISNYLKHQEEIKTLKADVADYWKLSPAKQRLIVDQVIFEEKICECLDLTPVKPGDKYVYCVECGAMHEIITPYVVKKLKAVED